MNSILDDLNPSQVDAVQTIDGPILILAGAGSGKTKTITSRLAYLIDEVGIPPGNTLTLTFTNKAAGEMRERALRMVQGALHPPLLCTFHKFGLLFLKFNIERLNRRNSFVLIDVDDKRRIIKSISDELPPQMVDSEISRFKNSLLPPEEAWDNAEHKNHKLVASIYQKYEQFLLEKNMVDFDDLLALSYKVLLEDDGFAKEISQRYNYIMVDEYQDTNDLQSKLLDRLCFAHQNLCVVGDDDQSIYGWRGANVRNILEFSEEYPGTKVIKLEENYRSTPQILKVANELIIHNRNRLGKTLKNTLNEGKEVMVMESKDENDEANKIASEIRKLLDSGVLSSEIAILFRLNALSRSIEEGLNRYQIPYKLVGAVRFYERAEVKDLLSYFRILTNIHDDFSLKRIINKPKRGLGKVTIDKLERLALERNTSMYDIVHEMDNTELTALVGKKNAGTIREFFEDVLHLAALLEESPMKFIDAFDDKLDFKAFYASRTDPVDRVSNIEEVYGLFRDFIKQQPEMGLDDFLNDISLRSDQDYLGEDSVSCMSIHASKGLEFKHLYVVGLEEGFFPLVREGNDLEEERRLGYVAITRAKEELTMCHAHSRFYKGKRSDLEKSRFLEECGLIKGSLKIQKTTAFKKGDLVNHKLFGIGRVNAVGKSGKEFKLKINFGGIEREILSSFVHKV